MSTIITVPFTTSFIAALAGRIEEDYIVPGRSLKRLAIVFGGKRPAHFLKRELSRRINKAFVPPRFFTIDEFMALSAGSEGKLAIGQDLEEAFEIYQLARDMAPELLEGRASFAKFLPWARDILDLIGQLDLEDVGPEALKNIQESARIGYAVPANVNKLLEKILLLREAFHRRLAETGRTSRGLLYLRAKENADAVDWSAFDEIIFANFFSFHRTEEAVVKGLYASGKATLIFQGDQTKWLVLERIAKRFGCELKEGPQPCETNFDLKVYSASDVHAEAAVVRKILSEVPEPDRTVVILPDSGALVPLLSALPAAITDLNVSMGYPLSRSSLWLLLWTIFNAQRSSRDSRYYTKDYLAVMQHPFAKNLRLFDDPAVMRVLVHKIEEASKGRLPTDISGNLFISLGDVESCGPVFESAQEILRGMGIDVTQDALTTALSHIHRLMFTSWELVIDLSSFTRSLGIFLDEIMQRSALEDYPLNVTIASRMCEIKDQMAQSSLSQEPFEPEDVFRIFEDKVERELVNFSGTPLKGLQVLGLFETRSLNFDHVIVLDTNEGVLPRIDIRASLIPREVMVQLNLDRMELEEEIQRYQFMRVISSAKTVHLVCQKNREKEPSRFVEELVWEVQRKKGRLEPYPTARAGFKVQVSGERRQAAKTPRMVEFLKGFTYSASSLNTYLKNPYEFYMTYVLGLREERDLLDEPDAAFIGDFMHKLLEEAYRPFVGRSPVIDESFAKRLRAIFDRRFVETFERKMRSDAFLVRTVMEHKLDRFVEVERERAPFIAKIVGLEEEIAGFLELPSAGRIAFKARVDRIEELKGGGLLVLDYKTGSSDRLPPKELQLPDDPSREDLFKKVRSLQLPLYMHFVSQHLGCERVNAGLYSLRESQCNLIFKEKDSIPPVSEYCTPFLQAADEVLSGILDLQIPFVDDDLKNYD